MVKNTSAHAGAAGDVGLISGLGISPGGGHGTPFQYSCLENPMDRGAWWATVHGVVKSQTQLKGLSTHVHAQLYVFLSPQIHMYTSSFPTSLEQFLRPLSLAIVCSKTLNKT